MTQDERLETIAKVLSKIMFGCKWKWETPNERLLEMLMKDAGYYPYKDEDEMMRMSDVDETLYKEAIERVPAKQSENYHKTQGQNG